MKVILLKDVAKIGRRFDIVDVPDGYAMNKLVPGGLAQPASPENVKRVRAKQDVATAKGESDAVHYESVLKALAGKTATLSATANKDGGLFETLKPDRIAEALTKAAGMQVLAEYVSVEHPIKHVGEHDIMLSQGGKSAVVTLSVTAG